MKPTIFLFLMLAFSAPVMAQDTVPVTIEDLKNFRKSVNDAMFWEKTANDRQKQIDAANLSASNWEKLYLQEKARADGVQEKRVTEATAAATDFQKANVELRDQNTELKQDKRDLENKVASLKSARPYVFGAGAVTGGLLGFIGGRQTCGTSIPGLPVTAGRPDYTIRPTPFDKAFEMPKVFRSAVDVKKPFGF